MAQTSTLSAVIIGDELLSGKIRDVNSPALIDLARGCGVALGRIVTIGDDPAQIAREIGYCSEHYDHVVTSGGLGPTHDDRTMEGLARAFECPLVRHPQLERLVREHFGDRLNDAALKLAEAPEGARLLDGGAFPTVAFRNIFILPGVPEIFAAKLDVVRRFLHGRPRTVYRIYVRARESDIAAELGLVHADDAEVQIGSYPQLGRPDFDVIVTVESLEPARARAAVSRLVDLLPAAVVIRIDPTLT